MWYTKLTPYHLLWYCMQSFGSSDPWPNQDQTNSAHVLLEWWTGLFDMTYTYDMYIWWQCFVALGVIFFISLPVHTNLHKCHDSSAWAVRQSLGAVSCWCTATSRLRTELCRWWCNMPALCWSLRVSISHVACLCATSVSPWSAAVSSKFMTDFLLSLDLMLFCLIS